MLSLYKTGDTVTLVMGDLDNGGTHGVRVVGGHDEKTCTVGLLTFDRLTGRRICGDGRRAQYCAIHTAGYGTTRRVPAIKNPGVVVVKNVIKKVAKRRRKAPPPPD